MKRQILSVEAHKVRSGTSESNYSDRRDAMMILENNIVVRNDM